MRRVPTEPASWLVASFLCAACASAPSGSTDGISRAEAEGVLAAQAACWNRGDLRGFVQTYWQGPDLTFLGAGGLTRGAADLLARYEAGYPDSAARGRLEFTVLEFRPLASGTALLLGTYHIARAQPSRGVFTLVLQRREGAVRIVHDHSTEARDTRAR